MGLERIAEEDQEPVRFRSRAEAREVLERTFERADADESVGPLLRAAGVRECLDLHDLGLTVGIFAGAIEHCLEWSFDDRLPFEPRLTLSMDAAVANAVLQGSESIAIAIARGRIRAHGDAGAALVHLPAMRLICLHYSAVIAEDYPHLVLERAPAGSPLAASAG